MNAAPRRINQCQSIFRPLACGRDRDDWTISKLNWTTYFDLNEQPPLYACFAHFPRRLIQVRLPTHFCNTMLPSTLVQTAATTAAAVYATTLFPSFPSPATDITRDPWQCATENITHYFDVPKPTGELLDALVDYGAVFRPPRGRCAAVGGIVGQQGRRGGGGERAPLLAGGSRTARPHTGAGRLEA